MTKITLEDVKHLANLSNLELEEKEAQDLTADLDNIVSYIEQLGELNTEGVEPTYQVTGLENVWRDDEIIDYGLSREQLISLAKDKNEDSVKVPKVL